MERGLGMDDSSGHTADGRSHGRHDALRDDKVSFKKRVTHLRSGRIRTGSKSTPNGRPPSVDVCVL